MREPLPPHRITTANSFAVPLANCIFLLKMI
jgi:hypothetical protein